MVIRVDVTTIPARLSLDEPEIFDRFSAVVEGDADTATVQSALKRIGSPGDADHVFVDPVSLCALAGRRSEAPEWQQKLHEMLAFARSKGWVDYAGRVRAHVKHLR